MIIYCSYIVGGVILYVFCGMPLFYTINYSIGAVSTGDFSTKVESIGYYDSVSIELVTIILILLKTINFPAHSILPKGRVKDFFRVGNIKFMRLLLLISTPLTLFVTIVRMLEIFSKGFRVAAFEIVSLNINDVFSFKRPIKYNYIMKPEGKVVIDDSIAKEIIIVFSVFLFIYIICIFILLEYRYKIKDVMFEIAFCLSSVGLSAGIIYLDAPKGVIWTRFLAMFLGRLEFLIIFYAILKIYKDFKFKFDRNLILNNSANVK